MKRPVFITALGFIVGIIGGLYFNIIPLVLALIIIVIIIIKFFKISIKNKYLKIINIFIQNNTILLFCISALVSNIYLTIMNKEYEKIYDTFESGEIVGIIVSNEKETEYKKIYKLKLESYNNNLYKNKFFLLELPKNKNIKLNYGDNIKFYGQYVNVDEDRNYKGFNYRKYLKTQKIYGKFRAEEVNIQKNNDAKILEIITNNIRRIIIHNINNLLPEDTKELFLSILIGYTDNLQEAIQEDFKQSNLAHLLAVSGSHIAYIILELSYLFKKIKINKKVRNVLISLFLVAFMYITNFTSSVMRATIMGIISLLPLLVERKQDIKTTIGMSILLILINNPYKILDIGLILSYSATIGIIIFSSQVKNKKHEEDSNIKNIILMYLKGIVLITIYANIFVIPIMAYNFNTISFTFVISNLLAGIIIGPITIGGFILIFSSFINIKFAYIISMPYNLLLKLLKFIAEFVSEIPLSQVFVTTPSITIVISYYIVLFLIIIYHILNKKYTNRYLVKRYLKFINNLKINLKRKAKILLILLIIFNLLICILKKIPKDLKIYFIDVGQGDSTLIITPSNKKLLIDSGGSESESFDIGKSTLCPYLLDRKIKKLDYIFISHFDSDHCKGFIYLLNTIKVENMVISKQYENTKNFEDIIKIAREKNIKIHIAKSGDRIQIERNIFLNVLYPKENQLLENAINNNSLVFKLCYKSFSILFTGDIEEVAEKEILNLYKNKNFLKSTVLKVAHHGSKTSSTEKFLDEVKPKIALIGVGKDNKFGHPNKDVIERLNKLRYENL